MVDLKWLPKEFPLKYIYCRRLYVSNPLENRKSSVPIATLCYPQIWSLNLSIILSMRIDIDTNDKEDGHYLLLDNIIIILSNLGTILSR